MSREKEKVFELLEQNNGHLLANKARAAGVSYATLQRMVKSGEIERAEQGLYVKPDIFPDIYFIAQYRCPKGVFSHETALYLHDLCDRIPLRFAMTIPSGSSTRMIRESHIEFFYCKPSLVNEHTEKIVSEYGNEIVVYDMERTLCDCIRHSERIDLDLFIAGFRWYVRSPKRDYGKLLDYARFFKIHREVQSLLLALL